MILTTTQFENWLRDIRAESAIMICEDVNPTLLSQFNTEFAKTYARIKQAADAGFVYIQADGNKWFALRHITPKRMA